MILDAHAIVHPLAVVIETFHALVTDVAVPRVSRANNLAMWAEQVSLEFFH